MSFCRFARPGVGPFVQTVASATWFAAIDGFFDGELDLDHGGVAELLVELRELLLRVAPNRVADLEIPALDLKSQRVLLSGGDHWMSLYTRAPHVRR